MSKRDPHRFEFQFDAETEPFETDLLHIFLTRKGARCVRGCIDIELAAGDETITVTVPGRLEDKGPRRPPTGKDADHP